MKIPRIDAVRALRADTFDVPDDLAPLRIVTDTRAIAAGDTFLALRGERFDGHAFVAQARERGAVAAIVDASAVRVPGMPTFVVRDTLQAYMALAGVARDALDDPIVAITGSTGKTTTKAFAAQLLALVGRTVFATPENENNEIGASKFFLAQEPVRGVRVVEMGMRHPGDIAALVRVARPTVAVVTNVGDAHLGEMGSHAAIAREKYSIFDGGASAVVNASDATAHARAATFRDAWWFASDPDALPADANGAALHDSHALVVRRGGDVTRLPVNLAVPGRHNRANLAAACAIALAIGVDAAAIAAQLHAIRLPSGRFERIELANGAAIVYDAYNASPAGMCAALEAFAETPAARHIAVLASMRELGPDAPAMHADVGAAAAAAKPERLYVGGEFANDIARGARDAGYPAADITAYRDNDDVAALLAATMRAGDLALLKGSRYYAMEYIVAALRKASGS